MKRYPRLLISLLVVLLLLAACDANKRASNELTICSSLPLNNGDNARAVSMRDAIQLAIDQKQSVQMGGQTYRLRHVPLDDTVPETGSWNVGQETRNARAAITEHDCIGYIGTYNSGAAKIAIPILNRVQMVMISPGNTYPGLTKPGGGIGDEPWIYSPLGPDKRNFCRVVPADDLQAPAAARYAKETLGVQRVAVFHDTELYGRGLADLFASESAALGMEVVTAPFGVSATRINANEQAYIAETARQLTENEPDLIYFGGNASSGAGLIYRELRSNGYRGYFMGGDSMAEQLFIDESRLTTNTGKVFATLVSLPADQLVGEGERFYNDMRSRYGEPDPFAAPSYEATNVLLAAIERATVPEGDAATLMQRARPAVLAAVRQTKDFNGVMGSAWSFDENCDTTLTTITLYEAKLTGFDFIAEIK